LRAEIYAVEWSPGDVPHLSTLLFDPAIAPLEVLAVDAAVAGLMRDGGNRGLRP